MNQDWNDPKSKLQQCCLTLRTMDGDEPDIPIYKVIECNGPTNTRVYTVAVYFRGKRLACSNDHSIQQAEMNAAKQALENSKDLFPQLDHQKRVIAQSLKRQKCAEHPAVTPYDSEKERKRRRGGKKKDTPKETKPAGCPLVEQYEALSDEADLGLEAISESEEDFGGGSTVKKKLSSSLTSLVSADEDESLGKVDKPVTFANLAQMFKVEGTDDVSSDLESGENE